MAEEWQIKPELLNEEQLEKFQQEISIRQRKAENDNENVLVDTTLIDSLWYAEWTEWYEDRVREVMDHFSQKTYDIIFYTPIEFDIEDDWLRHIDWEYQKLIDQKLKANLSTFSSFYDIEIVEAKWTLEERLNIIDKTLKKATT